MENTLKMIFTLDDGKTLTLSLASPREDLTQAAVEGAANTIISKQAFMLKGAKPTALKKAYIHSVEDKAVG